MISAEKALKELKQGNRRFVAERLKAGSGVGAGRRDEVVAGQRPFAIILACSDSRVPVEILFDQGLGDLFVIRVAGNIALPSQIGSIEFAASQFGSRLVVVLGHEACGAIQATLTALKEKSESASPHINAIVNQIRPAVEPVLASGGGVPEAVRANVDAVVAQLLRESTILADLHKTDGLELIGAEYAQSTGQVIFHE